MIAYLTGIDGVVEYYVSVVVSTVLDRVGGVAGHEKMSSGKVGGTFPLEPSAS